MNTKERKILNRIQEDFPLIERPYAQIGRETGLSEKEVMATIKKMLASGVIRRFGVLVNHKKLDYFSTLLGVRVSAARLPQIVAHVTRRPEVTHCYQREGEYNLWFTFLTPKKTIFEKFLVSVKKKVGSENVMNLPTIRSFKLKTTFAV